MNKYGFSDDAFNQFELEMKEAEDKVKRIAFWGACLSAVSFFLLFALMIAAIFWLVSNA